MNEGFAEAAILAGIISKTLRQEPVAEAWQTYESTQRAKWERLLAVKGGLVPRTDTDPWVRDHATRILACLPGSGPYLKCMAAQLELDVI